MPQSNFPPNPKRHSYNKYSVCKWIIYEDLGLSYFQVFISSASENSYISNIFLTLAVAFENKSFRTVDSQEGSAKICRGRFCFGQRTHRGQT